MSRICIKCGASKEESEYYVNNGIINVRCKECCKRDAKERIAIKKLDPYWVEQEKTRGRLKYHRLGYRETSQPAPGKKKEYISKYKDRFPEKERARTMASSIERVRGKTVHHWSYNDEHLKDVIQLTFKDHKKAHRFLVYDQEAKKYKTTSGELLDTREKHEEYIFERIKIEID